MADSNMEKQINAILTEAGLSSKGIHQWWHAKCLYLCGERPIEMVNKTPYKVLEAAQSFASGDYL